MLSTVGIPTLLGLCFNILVALALPVAVLIWLAVRRRALVWPFLSGALTFIVTQMLLRVPLLSWLGTTAWFTAFTMVQPVVYSLLLGLSAGVFEECGRYAAMRFTLRGKQSWQAAVAFGLGHGGIEAVMVVGLNNVALLAASIAAPGFYPLPAAGEVFMAGTERLFTLLAHVGWSVMVMRAVQRSKPGWLGLAVLLHGLVDGLIGILQMAGLGIYGIEAYVALCGLGMLAYTIVTIRREALHENENNAPAETG